jgi:anti-sigma B factor antagonist
MMGSIRQQDGVTVVEIKGRLDAVAAPEIKACLYDLIHEGRNLIVIDLSSMDFIDSAGLGVLVSCLRRAAAEGGDLRLAEVPPFCRSIFELTRLTRVFDVTQSLEQALEEVSDKDAD